MYMILCKREPICPLLDPCLVTACKKVYSQSWFFRGIRFENVSFEGLVEWRLFRTSRSAGGMIELTDVFVEFLTFWKRWTAWRRSCRSVKRFLYREAVGSKALADCPRWSRRPALVSFFPKEAVVSMFRDGQPPRRSRIV